MEVRIQLPLEVHDSLLSQLPQGLAVHRAVSTARVIRSFIDKLPLGYEVDCDEDVAQTLLSFARRHCPEAVTEIDFALRLARSNERQPRRQSWFR
jgi:hypothetical protein